VPVVSFQVAVRHADSLPTTGRGAGI
jgi:hypothetical protein